MTNKQLPRMLALSTVFLGLSTLSASAQTSKSCQPFTVVSDGSHRSVEYVEVSKNGPGPGDMRIGRRALVDQNGNDVGEYRWILTSLDAPPGSGQHSEALINNILNLDDGQLYFQSLTEAVRPASDSEQVSGGDFTAVVVGGTNAYGFARGTVDVSIDGLIMTFAVNIRCD